MAITKAKRSITHKNTKRSIASISGKKAWRKTIRPSHDEYEKKLKRQFKNQLVKQPTGLPDFIVHSKNTRFDELKPNRYENGSLAAAKGRYLNKNQENTVKRLLDEGVTQIYIVYYNQKRNKKFTFKEKKLEKKNYREFCCSTHKSKRFNVDDLF